MGVSAHGRCRRQATLVNEQHNQTRPLRPSTVQLVYGYLILQGVGLVVWFIVLAGCYALYIPVIRDTAVQSAIAVLYSVVASAVTGAYFAVSLIDPADQGCLVEESPLFCDQCQAFVHQGSKHCKECQKCVLGFDHHCKWVNNCIGSRNYKPFLALLSSMCCMLAAQLAFGIWLAVGCFTDAHETALRLAAAYPTAITLQQYAAALIVYSSVVGLALIPLGDLWLLHLVLAFRGLTTWDYIMANRDAKIEPSPLSRNVTKAFRYIRSLGPRSIRVHDEAATAATTSKRKVGINPCLACRTQVRDAPSTAVAFERFFRHDRAEGFDAALMFTPRLSMVQDKEKEEAARTAAATGQLLISVETYGPSAQQWDESSCLAVAAAAPSVTTAAAVHLQQRQHQQTLVDTHCSIPAGSATRSTVRFAE